MNKLLFTLIFAVTVTAIQAQLVYEPPVIQQLPYIAGRDENINTTLPYKEVIDAPILPEYFQMPYKEVIDAPPILPEYFQMPYKEVIDAPPILPEYFQTQTNQVVYNKSLPLFKLFESYPCPTSDKYNYKNAMDLGQQLAKDGKAIFVYTPVTETGYFNPSTACPGVRDELINVHHCLGSPITGFTNGDGLFVGQMVAAMKNPPVMDTAWHNTTTYTYDGKQLVINTKISRSKRISKGYKLRYIAIDETGKALNYFQSEWFGHNPYNDIPAKKANKVFRKTVTLDFECKVPFKLISFIEDWRLPNVSTNYAKPTVNAVIARKVKQ